MRVGIGEVAEGEFDPTARIVTTAEWINPYADISEEQKQQFMTELEPVVIPSVKNNSSEC